MKDHVTINALAPAHSHTLVLVTIEYSILYILEIPEVSQRDPRGIPEGVVVTYGTFPWLLFQWHL